MIAGSAMLVASVAMARGPGGEIKFAEIDADSNGEISIQEFQDHKLNRIKAIDTNGDGNIETSINTTWDALSI